MFISLFSNNRLKNKRVLLVYVAVSLIILTLSTL